MRVTHIGHSCVLIEAAGTRVLLDPGVFSPGFVELTDLDAIVVTHQHLDHLDGERLPALLEANDGARLLAEPETAAGLNHVGMEATALHPGQSLAVAGLTVAAVGGLHAVVHEEIARVGNVGVVLRAPGEPTFFHPGDAIDTAPGDDAAPGGVDLLALPLAAPWAAVKEIVQFLRAVGPRAWFPMHDAVLSPTGRGLYVRLLTQLAPQGCELDDLAGAGARQVLSG